MHASPLLLAALAAPSSPSAAPAAAADFSFAQWVEDIIANPAGAHLSPSEAVEAKNAAVAKSTSPFQKRVNCDRDWARANANDASACLADLARRGAAGAACAIGDNEFSVQMCRIGGAQVVGSKAVNGRESVGCGDVARTGGG